MTINKHGMKMKNLRIASGETCKWAGYTQLSYDMATGEILTVDHSENPETSWSDYHDNDVITVLNARRHYTMQEIADAVYQAVSEYKAMAEGL